MRITPRMAQALAADKIRQAEYIRVQMLNGPIRVRDFAVSDGTK